MRIRSNIKTLFLSACTLLCACRQNVISEPADFVFSTENIEGDEAYYSKPAVITGHIANRDIYPNVTEVGITRIVFRSPKQPKLFRNNQI